MSEERRGEKTTNAMLYEIQNGIQRLKRKEPIAECVAFVASAMLACWHMRLLMRVRNDVCIVCGGI